MKLTSKYLECRRCKRKVISWSHAILTQLDIGHRLQFPCSLTAKLACDIKVIRLMRQRGLGNNRGRDTLGVPLIRSERVAEIWKAQAKHAYLVDGSARWNEDRSAAATPHLKDEPHSYSGLLRPAVNSLGEAVLGRKIVPYTAPSKYTGELIGLEYLYNQTGEVLQDYAAAIQELETATVADVEEDEGFVGSEEFQDLTDLTVPTLDLDNLPSATEAVIRRVEPDCSPMPPPVLQLPSPVSPVQKGPEQLGTTQSPQTVMRPPQAHSTPLTTAHCELSVSKESDQLSTSEDSSSHDDFGGPDNIEGYRSVQDLADYLVTLQSHGTALTMEECTNIITLWEGLADYDKQRTTYSPRHQSSQSEWRAQKEHV
ncbi:hypothetical protein SKAU_G00161620 [Synaphobranchus kaupii]|uniref:DUF6729 domain-containing protein n=1 Tax=Synaphobranchus kaupii TaxID=118154 RepID=A0A9Q1FJ39_SYNKA|nr:hypothetical protein SKAU_G00161620 [Synaphobranchus kaupii]